MTYTTRTDVEGDDRDKGDDREESVEPDRGDKRDEGVERDEGDERDPVSYTHLTLPTKA